MRSELISAYNEVAMLMPHGSKLVLFGSALSHQDPTDLDVVIVYDRDIIDPKQAFSAHNDFIESLSEKFSVPLHVIMLNTTEYSESNIKKHEAYLEL